MVALAPFFLVDRPAAHMAIVAGFVAVVGAWCGRTLDGRYHALSLLLLGLTLFSLLSNDVGVTWISIEAVVIAGAVAIGLPLTAAAVADAWRFFVLGCSGLALALFGVVALYVDPGSDAKVFILAFVFLLLGYGTIVWLTTSFFMPPGVVQLAPLLVVLRLRAVVATHPEALAPGFVLTVLGLAALLLAAFCVWREQDPKRFFIHAGIGQTGVVVFAFGLGTTGAVFAGLLHLTLLTLTRAAALLGGSRRISIVAMAGLPPFGMFSSFFLVMTATVQKAPWLALPLGVGSVVFAWALIAKLSAVPAGAPDGKTAPVWLLLATTVVLGFAMPAALVGWFASVAAALR